MEFYLKLYKIEIFDRPSIFFHYTGSLPRLLAPWTLPGAFWALRSIRVKIRQILIKIAVFAKISNFEKGPVLRSGLENRVFGPPERSIPKNDGKHLNFILKRKNSLIATLNPFLSRVRVDNFSVFGPGPKLEKHVFGQNFVNIGKIYT